MTLSCQFLSWLNSNYFHECVALNWTGSNITLCAKDVQIRSFFWSVFSVSLRIQSECREIPTRKNSALGHSPRSILPLHRVLPNTIKSYAVSQREVFTKNVSCKIFVLSAHFHNQMSIIFTSNFSPPFSHHHVFLHAMKNAPLLKTKPKQKQSITKLKQLRWNKNPSLNWLRTTLQMCCDGNVWPLH